MREPASRDVGQAVREAIRDFWHDRDPKRAGPLTPDYPTVRLTLPASLILIAATWCAAASSWRLARSQVQLV